MGELSLTASKEEVPKSLERSTARLDFPRRIAPNPGHDKCADAHLSGMREEG